MDSQSNTERRLSQPELALALTVFFSCAYFFQGGGWNQGAHFATTVALVEHGTILLDDYRGSTGDLANTDGHVVSAKPVATALIAVPAYLVSKVVTLGIENRGNQLIMRGYLTTLLTAGVALALLAVLIFRYLHTTFTRRDAMIVSLAMTLATPLWPVSTMLTSHTLVATSSFGAFVLLVAMGRGEQSPSVRRLVAAGALAALPAALEYMTAVLLLPFGLHALWIARPRIRVLWFGVGVAIVATIPLAHHTLAYGHPLAVGYESLANSDFARDAAIGFMGFDGFSLRRLYELTLGQCRGFFFVSPFLVASIPGLVRLAKDPERRPAASLSGSIAWVILLLVSSLTYWHSGSAIGSRYALLFVVFSTLPVATIFVVHRGWMLAGMGFGFITMLLGTSVCATPPPPKHPSHYNVIAWLWKSFSDGKLAIWQRPLLTEQATGNGDPSLPFAFNLGQLIGLPGLFSLLPYAVVLGLLVRWMWKLSANAASLQNGRGRT